VRDAEIPANRFSTALTKVPCARKRAAPDHRGQRIEFLPAKSTAGGVLVRRQRHLPSPGRCRVTHRLILS
jgi:hypothetical protein